MSYYVRRFTFDWQFQNRSATIKTAPDTRIVAVLDHKVTATGYIMVTALVEVSE